jgi:hypothetical protein
VVSRSSRDYPHRADAAYRTTLRGPASRRSLSSVIIPNRSHDHSAHGRPLRAGERWIVQAVAIAIAHQFVPKMIGAIPPIVWRRPTDRQRRHAPVLEHTLASTPRRCWSGGVPPIIGEP